MKIENLTDFNRKALVDCIEKCILDWEEFSISSFCEDHLECKESAISIVNELKELLSSIR